MASGAGGLHKLLEVMHQYAIGLVVVAITHEKSPSLLNQLTRLSFIGCQLMDMPSLF